MQPDDLIDRAAAWRGLSLRGMLIRGGCVAVIALMTASVAPVDATARGARGGQTPDQQIINTGASNGGTASASSGGNVNIGQIVTGENTGNSIATGDVAGESNISGGDINYPTDVNVSLNVGPPIASADGGDYGSATAPSPKPPEYTVNIDNKSKNNNKSSATGIGEGGAGGAGGDGGSVIVDGDEQSGQSGQ
jgi:hypothetical protein